MSVSRWLTRLIGVVLVSGVGVQSQAEQFTIHPSDVDQGGWWFADLSAPTFIGSGVEGSHDRAGGEGTVRDGGYDAYDGMGGIAGFNGLSVTRRTETLSSYNVYRWFDTYTNNTGSKIDTTVHFFGNLGSDSNTRIASVPASYAQHLIVTYEDAGNDGVPDYDPVIAHVYGNNAFAASNMTVTIGGAIPGLIASPDNFDIAISLGVDPGQSVSLLFLDFLARNLGARSGDKTLAINRGKELVDNPLFAGLSSTEIARTLNFNGGSPPAPVPEPSTLVLFTSLGAVGLLGAWRRRKQA